MVDITDQIQKLISDSGLKNGVCFIFVPHTTAAITINEGADSSVRFDIIEKLSRLVPADGNYRHLEGNADAHIKASLIGSSVMVLVNDGELALGTWQRIFFCEFDGPRARQIFVQTLETRS
ncbi:secondary thiamine-phosphate synthase enzyme YjbQ [Pseudothermotoga sp.]|nr:secondary thiamine-phosphate synthase enzyme YjbQ [Pseudothermotoga sp.]MDW8139987.1 secondary thiamine-phosphate synthase enzyme YjbQ [Pseudothermotoga sp.]